MTGDLESSLNVGDLDELIREVDRRCDRHDWEGVEEVRRRSRAAIERGHQVWPAASYAEYRLALDAPPADASAVITDDAGWMAPGPLAEVVAQRHTWIDLAPLLEPSARRAVVAAERVLRGEEVPDVDCGELPGRCSRWEPEYALAEYRVEGGRFPAPELHPPTDTVELTSRPVLSPDGADGAEALAGAVRHWASHSEGAVRAVGAEGDHLDALAALGHRTVGWRPCSLAEAGALLAWAAADGGAHGRRRGASVGRFELWWALAVLTGVDDDWPTDPGPEASELDFGLWLPRGAVTGWSCRLTVVDPEPGLAWALDAFDAPVR